MLDVVGLGTICIDHFFETNVDSFKKVGLNMKDECLWGENFKEKQKSFLKELKLKSKTLGGMTLNTIMILSKLGLKCGIVGMVGNDENGDFAINNMKEINIDEVMKGGNTTKCFCLITNKGKERTFVTYPNKHEDDIFDKINIDYVNNSKFVHLSALFTADMKITFEKVKKIITKIEGPKLAFTPSKTYLEYGIEELIPILEKTHIFFSNRWEMGILNKNLSYESKKLLEYGPKIVICTLGSEGVLVTTADKQFKIPAIKPKKIIDSTGAGDTFAAGFLYGMIKNKLIEEAAEIGTKLASRSLSGYGESWLDTLTDKFD